MKTLLKNNIKFVFGILVGALISGVSVYALTIASKDVSYNNANSGTTKTNVQDAVDELYDNYTVKINQLNSAHQAEITQLNNNFNTKLRTVSDSGSGYWSTGRVSSGSFSVTANAYYIITVFYEAGTSANVSGCNIIGGSYNAYHTSTHEYGANYSVYYVYTTSNTITVTANKASYLSWTKVRLFQ